MAVEDGKWVMHGPEHDEPSCIHSVEELMEEINKIGFLPLFQNEVPGFSVEERTVPRNWWSDDPSHDPWKWREIIARSGEFAYGKFFSNRAGFLSKQWLPVFCNARREGYDFDARWDDEKASMRQKKIMDLFDPKTMLFSYEVKQRAGFHKGGEKNFEGTITKLQMETYLCIRDFQQRKNKKGQAYGWSVALYTMPEYLWGYDYIAQGYEETPQESQLRIETQISRWYEQAKE